MNQKDCLGLHSSAPKCPAALSLKIPQNTPLKSIKIKKILCEKMIKINTHTKAYKKYMRNCIHYKVQKERNH